jgi:hypothetical protein
MLRSIPGVLAVCALLLGPAFPSGAARAETPTPKPVLETWHAAYFEGVKAGHVHTTVQEITQDGARLFRTTRLLSLHIRRYNSIVPLQVEMVCDEKADGKVVALTLTQILDKDKKFVTRGSVMGEHLLLRTNADPVARKVPWNDEVIGLYRQELIYQARKVKPGDSLHFLSYELAVARAVVIRAVVKPEETVDTLVARKDDSGVKVSRTPARLIRVETLADKIDVEGNKIQLPGQVIWLDKDLLPVRYEWEFPGLGRVTLYQTTKTVALEEGVAPALLPDLGLNTIVTTKTSIDKPYETTAAVYRISVKGDDEPANTFARDRRQQVRNVRATSFELHVRARGEPGKGEKEEVKKEFLASSYFLDSDDERIKTRAARIVGTETGALEKARLIEKWVHDSMKPSNSVGFATASQVCRDLTGDCRQHAMLTAALCRAAGVPSRTAVGLIYAREPGRSPVFIFHMWTEVLVEGQWHGLDATLGRGEISACHLKVTDHSWRDTHTLAPLLPVSRLLGKLSIEVLETHGR